MFFLKNWVILCFVFFLFCFGLMDIANGSEAVDSTSICQKYAKVSVPQSDVPNEQESKNLPCAGFDDILSPTLTADDAVIARKCAFVQIDQSKIKGEADFGISGEVVLIMAYANGIGVKKNLDVAIHFACALDGNEHWRDSQDDLVTALNMKKTANDNSKIFDVCDHAAGPIGSQCIARDRFRAEIKFEEKFREIQIKWSKSEIYLWQNMFKLFSKYVFQRSISEIDGRGTAYTSMVESDEKDQKGAFFSDVLNFFSGKTPKFIPGEFAKADRELNEVYKQTLKNILDNTDQGTGISVDAVKKTQRAWIKFRDAWVAFAKEKFPSTNPEVWLLWLTQNRTKMLLQINELYDTTG
jgi:uncharacterized protein YecT (DUF1311 family)